MSNFAPPPVSTPWLSGDKVNPVWVKWLVDLTKQINAIGGPNAPTGINHDSISGLQGGATNQYYHLTQPQHDTLTNGPTSDATTLHEHRSLVAISTLVPGGSPYVVLNSTNYDQDIIVSGGTVSLIEISRNNVNFYSVGAVAGMFRLSPGDRLRVTYTGAPTVELVQR